MSAFSRGCLLRQQCAIKSPRTTNLFLQPVNSSTPRFLRTTSLLYAARKSRSATPATKPKTSLPSKLSFTPTKASPTSVSTIYSTYAQTLAQKPHPTPLYEAPSQIAYIISNSTTALFCFAWSGYNVYAHYLYAPPGLAAWVPPAYMVVSIIMSGVGTYIALGSTRLVRTITAVPKKADPASGGGGRGGRELQIEIILRKMLPIPFFPARKLYVKPEDIILPSQLTPPPPKHLSMDELRRMRIEEEARRKQELEYERSHLLTSPFRHMSRGFFSLFKSIGRTWTRDGFLKVEIKDGMYKLDIKGGWALDGGRALDRLAKIKHRV
ncbi:hypothetical protein EG329_002155 [Mollisiaceae sp. DMI_Dod_QoI]|nr:hypothetical protein EG329_002155 [Helotiales sp. DMI_Dod_QoI]